MAETDLQTIDTAALLEFTNTAEDVGSTDCRLSLLTPRTPSAPLMLTSSIAQPYTNQ